MPDRPQESRGSFTTRRRATGPSVPSIGAGASAVTVSQGASATSTVTVMRGGGYTGTVTPSASGLPTGVTAVWSPTSGTGNTFILTLTASSGATVGTTTPTITMSGSGVTSATSAVGLTVRAAYTPVFFDDWTTYANTAALNAAAGVGQRYLAIDTSTTIDEAQTFEGHHTMRCRMYDADVHKNIVVVQTTPLLAHIWFRYFVRWTPGFSNDINNGYAGAKSAKQFSFNFSGANYGRILGAITNGSGAFGGTNNNGSYIVEMQHATGLGVYLANTVRNVIEGAEKMYNDGLFYEVIVQWQRISSIESVGRTWIQPNGNARRLWSTIRYRDPDYTGPVGADTIYLFPEFNATDGGPPVGVDESWYIGKYDEYNGNVTPDPFSIGTPADSGVDMSVAVNNASIALVRSGSSVTRTLTVTRGSALTGAVIETGHIRVGGSTQEFLPIGVTATLSATSLAAGVNTVNVTFSASGSASVGTSTVNAVVWSEQGTQSTGTASAFVPLTVTVT